MNVKLNAKGGGLTVGKSTIEDGHGKFSAVKSIERAARLVRRGGSARGRSEVRQGAGDDQGRSVARAERHRARLGPGHRLRQADDFRRLTGGRGNVRITGSGRDDECNWRRSRRRSARTSQSIDVLPQHRFDEHALWRYLQAQLDDFAGPAQLRQFQGGQSNPTFLIETPTKKFVLRKKPPGKLLPSAHLVEREYRILRALPGTDVPVPAARLLCEDAAIIGTSFYVMDHVEGRVITGVTLPQLTPAERHSIYATTRASARDCMRSIFARAGWAISASPKATSRASSIAGPSNTWLRRPKRTPTWSG